MSRQISNNGIKFTAAWETFRSAPYHATEDEVKRGIFTWGFGHTGNKPPGRNITLQEGFDLLAQDMAAAVKAVNAVASAKLNQAQFDAMCDLVFNVGPVAIGADTGTGKALRAGDIATLRKKLPQFVNQSGKRVTGLVRRAAGRLALFDGKSWQEAEAIGRAAN